MSNRIVNCFVTVKKFEETTNEDLTFVKER